MPTANDNVRLLLVSAAPAVRAAFGKALGQAGLRVDVIEAVDGAGAREVLPAGFDLICLDDDLAAIADLALISEIRALEASPPVLVLVNDDDEAREAALVEAGATACMPKGERVMPSRLAQQLRLIMRCARAEADVRLALAQATQAAASRDDMMAMVSHDLRGPLNSILLALDALSGDEAVLRALRRTVQRAERLLRDLLDVSRIEAGGMQLEAHVDDVGRVMSSLYEAMAPHVAAAGGCFIKELPPHPVRAKIDPDRLTQAVATLVENAMRHGQQRPITLKVAERPDAVVITVADQGRGIAAEQMPHMFDRSAQGRGLPGSAGLGLTIARAIAAAHGGDLTVESAPSLGAQFHLTLPRPVS